MSRGELIELGLEEYEVTYIAENLARNGEGLGDIVYVDFDVSSRNIAVDTVNETYDMELKLL